ncbi:unnamed protein product [Cylindrotheca closterium]|uniref:Uncharacterized protein n=1 Tax=Cylindrotheca closterium TaxID=2856 RepID=A0AAD2CI75_9STRA|nr:unnamed protein product [Cylindrotheca closterium]
MNETKQHELTALVEWIRTFPQLDHLQNDKENSNTSELLADPQITSSIFDIALEVYGCDGDETIMTHSSEIWDNILSLSRKTSKRRILDGTHSEEWGVDARYDALTSLLHGAISHPDIKVRGEYVGRITSMPDHDTQKSLMDMIARQKQEIEGNRREKRIKRSHAVDEESSTPDRRILKPRASSSRKPQRSPLTPKTSRSRPLEESDESVGRSLFTTPQRASTSDLCSVLKAERKTPSFLSPGLGDTAEYEKEVQGLREQNDELLSTLERYKRNEEDAKSRYEEMESKYRQEMMKIEAASCHRNEEIQGELQGKIRRLENDLSDMVQQLEASEEAKAELDTMKDELELMKHTKSLLDDTTERLNNYKEKLTQLTDIKDALEKEEEAHSRSVDENIRLKNEISSLHVMKRSLDDYKSRAVEAEVRFTEVHDELTKLRKQLHDTTNDSENLQTLMQSQKEQIDDLHRQIKHEGKSESSGSQLGSGVSELNPEINEELLRLRNENAQLRAFANKREDDAVAKMELNVEDNKRLAERYKSQFLSTKGRLETTQADLEQSISREQKLQCDYATVTEDSNRMQLQLQDTNLELANIRQNLDESRTRESMLEEELSSWVDQARTLQEQTDEMTNRFHSCNENLDNAKVQEAVLRDKIAGLERNIEQCNQEASYLSQQFEDQKRELHDSNESCEELSQELSEWAEKAKSASDLANEISDSLAVCASELQQARVKNITIQRELDTASKDAHAKRLELKETQHRLSEVYGDLKQKETFIDSAKEREERLITDLHSANQRLDGTVLLVEEKTAAIAELEDKLEEALAQNKRLLAREETSTVELKDLRETTHKMKEQIARMQHKADTCDKGKSEALSALKKSEEEIRSLDLIITETKRELEESQSNGAAYLQQTHTLESELVETRDNLLKATDQLAELSKAKTEVNEKLNEAHGTISDLKEKLSEEVRARAAAKEEIALLRVSTSEREADLNESIEEMRTKWQKEIQIANGCKHEIDCLNEALDESQSALSAAQHRENMLHHKIRVLEDRESELTASIEATRESANKQVLEATKSFEATRQVLNSKATKDVEDLQNRMNLLLDEERRGKRQIESENKEKLKQQKEKMERELANAKDKAASTIERTQTEARLRCQQMQKEHEETVLKMKEDANQESTQLVRKGKGMIKELKTKQLEERGKLENQIRMLEERCNLLSNEMETTTSNCNSKVREYRKKLQFASGKITQLTTESDDLEGQIEALSRELSKLREENDRYRRQLGGRFGAESNAQNEMLRKELKGACDEIRELKRQQGASRPSQTNHGFNETHQNYNRDLASQSTISQLRSEYEETIEALNDEKRELVMKHSASITDVQKAEMRAWETEQDNATLKEELVSLRLQIERIEKTYSEDKLKVNSPELTSEGHAATPVAESGPILNTSVQNIHKQDEREEDSNITNADLSSTSPELPMVFQHHGTGGRNEEHPPECTQS